MKYSIYILSLFFMLVSCSQQKARKPISNTENSFINESIERNKKLIANEEKLIQETIKKDTLKEYIASSKGYWYKYDTKVDAVNPTPKRGDIAYFDYEIKDLVNQIIYSKQELKPQEYYVDKENILMGLRDGIKLMKKGNKLLSYFLHIWLLVIEATLKKLAQTNL